MNKIHFFWIYILELRNGHFYTGYTTNLARRYLEHLSGISGAKYTRNFQPIRIAQCWRLFDSKGMALRVEAFIKKKRKVKEAIIEKPSMLKFLIFDKLNLDLNIFVFDPKLIENELLESGNKKIKKGLDPFRNLPPEDIY